jgi:hypothetical protein
MNELMLIFFHIIKGWCYEEEEEVRVTNTIYLLLGLSLAIMDRSAKQITKIV